jgi:hypothetical protein
MNFVRVGNVIFDRDKVVLIWQEDREEVAEYLTQRGFIGKDTAFIVEFHEGDFLDYCRGTSQVCN